MWFNLLFCKTKITWRRYALSWVLSSLYIYLYISFLCPRKRRQYCFHNFVNTIAHELLHLAWWNSPQTCTLTTSRTLLSMKVIDQRSESRGFLCVYCVHCARYCLNQLIWIHFTGRGSDCGYPRGVLSLEQGSTISFCVCVHSST